MQINDNSEGRIFKNPILEFFSRNNIRYTASYYVLLIPLLLFLSQKLLDASLKFTLTLYLLGLLVWSLKEYLLHRYLFHIDEYFPSLKRFHYIVHGIHHKFPKDKDRLLMPPLPGSLIAIFLLSFWYVFIGSKAFALMAGVINGYLIYGYIHYTVHANPKHRLFKRWWRHHALHHHKFHEKAFGVSTPFWDWVFGTMPTIKKSHNNVNKDS